MPNFSKRYDANRRRKTYPFVRRVPVYKFEGENQVIIETASVAFTAADEVTHTFTEPFTAAPVVTLTAKEDNVNVYISAVTTTSVTINASAAFTGSVELHAIQVVV